MPSPAASAPAPSTTGSRVIGLLRRHPWLPVIVGLVALFLWFVSRFYSPQTGFSCLIVIGDAHTPSTTLLDQHPYIQKGTGGYDGQAYVQIALDPLLRDPQLATTVDNLDYRARRILVPAFSWLAGLGQPAWIVQAYALSNVAGWLLLGWVLLRWLPPDSFQNVFRWAAIMFSQGMGFSFRWAVTDGPGLALLALGLALAERQRIRGSLAAFAAAILSRETFLINVAAGLLPASLRDRRGWLRAAGLTVLATLPLLLWMAYVRTRSETSVTGSSGNFAWPGVGYFGRWRDLFSKSDGEMMLLDFRIVGYLSQVALTVQFLYIVLRPRLDHVWWRVAAISALLGLILGPAVWEGFPTAALRVLLPITVAFNLLVPRSLKWFPLLLVGNLTIFGGVREMTDVPTYFNQWQGERGAIYSTALDVGKGWYPIEGDKKHTWRWTSQTGELVFTNHGDTPVSVVLKGKLSVVTPREILLERDGRVVWRSGQINRVDPFQTQPIVITPGVTRLLFTSDQPPAHGPATDSRQLSFALYDLVLSVNQANQAP